jgi:hypothetical protein
LACVNQQAQDCYKEIVMNPFDEIAVLGKVSEETKGGGFGKTDPGSGSDPADFTHNL